MRAWLRFHTQVSAGKSRYSWLKCIWLTQCRERITLMDHHHGFARAVEIDKIFLTKPR